MAPFFSICLPVYNGESFIRKAIESVVDQSFHDWNLIIIDNASTDGTFAIAKEYESPKIRVLQNSSNLGMRGNLNRCLEVCDGEWLGILPADDFYVAHCLMSIHQELQARQDCILWAHCHLAFGEKIVPNIVPVYNYLTEFKASCLRDKLFIKGNIFGELSSYFVRISAFRKRNISFSDGTQTVDSRFYIRLLNATPDAIAIYWPDVLTHALQHAASGSTINNGTGETYVDFFEFFIQLKALPWPRKILFLQCLRIIKTGIKFHRLLPRSKRIRLPARALGSILARLLTQ